MHTTETPASGSIYDVARHQLRARDGSYHVLVDAAGRRMRANTDDWCTWSTGNLGNRVLLHLAFVAEACWSRQEWLAQPALLAAGADVAAHWCGRYGIPARQATVAKLPGITTHDATRAWGGTDHTDPGEGFPWTEFLAEVRARLG
ncbi:N-acetylmuramoyl-L-alanine amidase [Corynebacterium frankenforstense]|uniref:N-acetylmuramoyl-L-alanine amidase n=1 Tax=Corynebacterium frankenforstense TaxID=1230998 RepID=UPI0026EB4D56|nr:N-acetylmuramoyl-L-alanine amidase [Corynebacterium frankenforstense]